jgi:predicted DNA-binding transcriptional regulator AlpA
MRPKTPTTPDFVKVVAVARRLGVSMRTVQSWAGKGSMPPIMVLSPHVHVFDREQIEQWLAEKRACSA